jgi:hypothetical protein
VREYTGILKRVGAKEDDMIVNSKGHGAVGNVRVSGLVSVVEIGDTVLRNVGCTRDIYDLLDVGKTATLYVHFKNFRKPIILGVGYPGERRGFTVPLMSVVANTILSLIIFPIMFLILGLVLSGISTALGVVVILGGIGLTLYNVITLIMGYARAAAATRQLRAA